MKLKTCARACLLLLKWRTDNVIVNSAIVKLYMKLQLFDTLLQHTNKHTAAAAATAFVVGSKQININFLSPVSPQTPKCKLELRQTLTLESAHGPRTKRYGV